MFGIGTSELLIILVIALIVLGPKEIPRVVKTLGKGIRELKKAKDELKEHIEFESIDVSEANDSKSKNSSK